MMAPAVSPASVLSIDRLRPQPVRRRCSPRRRTMACASRVAAFLRIELRRASSWASSAQRLGSRSCGSWQAPRPRSSRRLCPARLAHRRCARAPASRRIAAEHGVGRVQMPCARRSSSRAPLRSGRARRRHGGRCRRRRRQIVMGVAIAAHHVIGGGAHGVQLRDRLQRGIGACIRLIRPSASAAKSVGKIEARQRQPRAIGFFGLDAAPALASQLPLAWRGNCRRRAGPRRQNRESTGPSPQRASAAGESPPALAAA